MRTQKRSLVLVRLPKRMASQGTMTATQLILVWIVVYVTPYSPLRIGQLDRPRRPLHSRAADCGARSIISPRSLPASLTFPAFSFRFAAAGARRQMPPAARRRRHLPRAARRGTFEFRLLPFCASGLSVNRVFSSCKIGEFGLGGLIL